MRIGDSRRSILTAAVALLLLALPVGAQSDDGEDDGGPAKIERKQRVVAEFGFWVAQPAGLEYNPASRRLPNDSFDVLSMTHGTETENRWRLAYRLPGDQGQVGIRYYSHLTFSNLSDGSPGVFDFGTLLAHPAHPGYANDSFADAFDAQSQTRLRDARIEYARTLDSGNKFEIDWSIGWRRVWHSRAQNATYFSLVPDIPPLLPPLSTPRPDLDPVPDTASMSSSFEGRGPSAGLSVRVPLYRDRVLFEGSVDLAVLRGKVTPRYSATSSYYTFDDERLDPPYDVIGETEETGPGTGVFVPLADRVEQVVVSRGLQGHRPSASSQVQAIEFGLRWRATNWIDVFGGFRSAHYTDVGVDLVPLAADSITSQAYRVINRSVTYEGFYAGVSFYVF